MKKFKLFILIIGLIIFGIVVIFVLNNLFINGIKGLGENEKRLAFDENANFDENNSNIIDIEAGDTYTAILKEDGSVWVSGKNKTYTSNEIYDGIKVDNFTKMKIDNVKQIGVGSNFVIALKDNGDVYSWGGNSYSELGIEGIKISKPYQVPRKVNIKNIEKIYVLGNQAAAISKEGVAYYWGYAVDSYNNIIHKFEKEKVVDVFLVQSQYYFKTENNNIYAIGYDFEGITNEQNGWARKEILINSKNVAKIVSYNGYEGNNSPKKYVLKENGEVYILNTKEKGELETKIEGLENIKDIYVIKNRNQDKSCFFAVDGSGNLYSYNTNFLGENITNEVKKHQINNVKEIKEKEGMILILRQDGSLYNLGYSVDNLKEHQGAYQLEYYLEEKELNTKNVKLVTLGKNFIIVVDKNNNIYKQGSNKDGALGKNSSKNFEEIFTIN